MHYQMGHMITCLNLAHNHKMFDCVFDPSFNIKMFSVGSLGVSLSPIFWISKLCDFTSVTFFQIQELIGQFKNFMYTLHISQD
jgi:hypothetical protein